MDEGLALTVARLPQACAGSPAETALACNWDLTPERQVHVPATSCGFAGTWALDDTRCELRLWQDVLRQAEEPAGR